MDIVEYLAFVTSSIAQAALRRDKTEVVRLLRILSESLPDFANRIEGSIVRCHYPNCRAKALWIPVIALPTLRTAGESKAMVPTTKPTLLLFVPVCGDHKDTYALTDWIGGGDWSAMQDVAHQNGYHIQDQSVMVVEFKPIGWTPGSEHLELERG